MRHIHADHMIAAANDTSIKWEQLSYDGIWIGDNAMYWWPEREYRQKPAPHPHQAMIDQAKADPSIEWQHSSQGSDWSDCLHLFGPQWHIGFNYRQKPAKPKMIDMWQWVVRMMYSKQITFTNFYATEAEAAIQVGKSGFIICRIEGSKITVPQVGK
jgi:hypothetical protein